MAFCTHIIPRRSIRKGQNSITEPNLLSMLWYAMFRDSILAAAINVSTHLLCLTLKSNKMQQLPKMTTQNL
jgi:hypothetical protein